MNKHFGSAMLAVGVVALTACVAPRAANSDLYDSFPVTLKGYAGDKTNSVSYSGQIARHVLHDSLKAMIGSMPAGPAKRDKLMAYYQGKGAGRAIVAPTDKGVFKFKQKTLDAISKGKNLAGKTDKRVVSGMPRGMTGAELVKFWLAKAAETDNGYDAANGYDYAQLVSKYVMGAVSYHQAVDNYLDEKLAPDNKPNSKPYKKGAYYTGKEHAWDEAFGYFGAPAKTAQLSVDDIYNIAKRKGGAATVKKVDLNGDGMIDLKSEMVFGPAYYAAAFDRSAIKAGRPTGYTQAIFSAYVEGRQIIAGAKGAALSAGQISQLKSLAATIRTNWEKVLAEAVFKYAGSVLKDMVKIKAALDTGNDPKKLYRAYVKHWGELKGFSLALQSGKGDLGEVATKLNRLVGAGPLLLNASQVVDIDRNGNYMKDQGETWAGYMVHMVKVQKLMAENFQARAKVNDFTGKLASLVKAAGGGSSAEND